MNDHLYSFIAGIVDLFLWGGDLIGEENLPSRGPAVFIGNHLDATGPIAAACSLPVRTHPWIIADMMDPSLAADWLQADFVERQLLLEPPISRWLAKALSTITVPLFHSLGCIPVYRGDPTRLQDTFRLSLDLLCRGKFLLIYPEDNLQPTDPVTKMQPFQHSFVRLAELYYEATRQRLTFVPIATHSAGYLRVGEPVLHQPRSPVVKERRRLKSVLEQAIIRMYLELDEREKIGEVFHPVTMKR